MPKSGRWRPQEDTTKCEYFKCTSHKKKIKGREKILTSHCKYYTKKLTLEKKLNRINKFDKSVQRIVRLVFVFAINKETKLYRNKSLYITFFANYSPTRI